MRRRPVEPPHLSTTDRHTPAINSARRMGIVPSQTTLSVQNIPDYSTPAGSAMANEEFRRLRLAVKAVEDSIVVPDKVAPAVPVVQPSPVSESTVINESTTIINNIAIPETMESGFVYLNRLPFNPNVRQPYDARDYRYESYNYTPENGYYGWYVYGIIKYKFKLPDPKAYILNLIDVHEIQIEANIEELKIQAIRDYINGLPKWIDVTNPDVLKKVIYDWYQQYWIPGRGFEKQEGYPEDEPVVYQETADAVREDAIIVRGVYKPDMDYYRGILRQQNLYFVDELNRIARTNLIFYYTLHRKV